MKIEKTGKHKRGMVSAKTYRINPVLQTEAAIINVIAFIIVLMGIQGGLIGGLLGGIIAYLFQTASLSMYAQLRGIPLRTVITQKELGEIQRKQIYEKEARNKRYWLYTKIIVGFAIFCYLAVMLLGQ